MTPQATTPAAKPNSSPSHGRTGRPRRSISDSEPNACIGRSPTQHLANSILAFPRQLTTIEPKSETLPPVPAWQTMNRFIGRVRICIFGFLGWSHPLRNLAQELEIARAPAQAAAIETTKKTIIGRELDRKTIYHSPQTPGYTGWV